jgi:hypothetical protein
MDQERATSPFSRQAWERSAAVVSVVLAFAACSSSKSGGPATSSTTISGVVTDSTGAVLTGATVSAGGATTMTSANGSFSLGVAPQANVVVDFSKAGYLESSKALIATAGSTSHVSAALKAMAAMMPLDATQGGSVTGAQGASLTAGPGVFVDPAGNPVTGSVQVSLTPLSPSVPGDLAAYPGALVGSTTGAGPSLLQTYGVLNVTVMQNGQDIQVAPGQTVTVTIPVTATGTLPPTQDLWSFNLATGMWDHEGTATLMGAAYTAQLAHFSYHNIDAAIVSGQATCVTGLVVDKSGNPVAGAYVSPSEGASVDTLLTTDSSGQYCTWVLSGGSETLTADSTATPFGEGSITLTGGAAVTFPASYPYTCSNLNCQKAPNIVLDQAPCMLDSDCPADDMCCTAKGTGMCLESFACDEATGSFPTGTGALDGSISSGGQCEASTGTITAILEGQTYVFDCYGATNLNNQAVEFTGTQLADGGSAILLLGLADPAGLSAGTSVAFSSEGGANVDLDSGSPEATLLLTEGATGDLLECTASSGSVTVNPWSTSLLATVGYTISNDTQLNCIDENVADGNFASFTGTISGTVTLPLL